MEVFVFAVSSSNSTAILYPEDLGPATIDITNYPPRYQKIYQDILKPMLGSFGGPARLFNSPIIELNSEQERAERRSNPRLFSDSLIAQPSAKGWKKRVEEIRLRPPCCGACAVLTRENAKQLWEFLVYDSLARKTGKNAQDWIRHREALVERFQREYSERFKQIANNQ